jgi:hypothetical protein
MTQQTSTLSRTETDYNDSMHTMYAPYLFNDLHVVSNTGCKSQDSVGEIGTGIWVGKRSENTDFRQGNGPQNYTDSSRRILGFTYKDQMVACYQS